MQDATARQTQTQTLLQNMIAQHRDRFDGTGGQRDPGAADQPAGVIPDHLDAFAIDPDQISSARRLRFAGADAGNALHRDRGIVRGVSTMQDAAFDPRPRIRFNGIDPVGIRGERIVRAAGSPARLRRRSAAQQSGKRGSTNMAASRLPCPDTLSFASSTATSISARAYGRRPCAAIIDAVVDIRRHRRGVRYTRRGHARRIRSLSRTVANPAEVVFSPSGTDSQLHALVLARALLGPALTTVIVAADQTGSGTADTSRGSHFSAATAHGSPVQKSEPIAGFAHSVTSVAVGLLDENGDCRPAAETDAKVLDAIEASVANGTGSCFRSWIVRSSAGARRASDASTKSRRAGPIGSVVVDACQMRLGRPRLRKYLDRGYLVIVTGSKFFTGPAFSGALLVPAGLANAVGAIGGIAPGFRAYSSRSDWPAHWQACGPLSGPAQSRPMAALGSGAGGDPGLSRRARPVSPAGFDEFRPGSGADHGIVAIASVVAAAAPRRTRWPRR